MSLHCYRRPTTAEMFPDCPELVEMIPDPSTDDITHMLGVMVEHNTCNTTRKKWDLLCSTIIEYARSKGVPENEIEICVLQV